MGIVLCWLCGTHCRETEAGEVSRLSGWSSPAPRVGQLARLLSTDYEVRVKLVLGTECLGLSPLRTGVGGGPASLPFSRLFGNLSPLAGSWRCRPRWCLKRKLLAINPCQHSVTFCATSGLERRALALWLYRGACQMGAPPMRGMQGWTSRTPP